MHSRYLNAILAAALLLFVAHAPRLRAQPTPAAALNSGGDDYAAAFRVTGSWQDGAEPRVELWLTTNDGFANRRSRHIEVSVVSSGAFDRPSTISDPAINTSLPVQADASGGVVLDGVPTFAMCGGAGVIVSNRPVDGRSFGNDLYEVREKDGAWRATRIDAVDSRNWDDTPALSPNGQILFFASDRANPGSRNSDLYYAKRKGDGWGEPHPLMSINTETASEESPHVGTDGYFYFATNRGGTYDIWRLKLDPVSGLPIGASMPVDLPGVNTDSTDETHPVLSPGGNWLLFSSNRGPQGKGTKDFDLYWTPLARGPITLKLNVLERVDTAATPIAVRVAVRDRRTGREQSITSDIRGRALLTIPRVTGDGPAGDLAMQEIILTPASPRPELIPSIDTLAFTSLCRDDLEHTLFLWDRAAYHKPGCTQEFPINKVRFFVTGYWCPTTYRYRAYTPCNSLFVGGKCMAPPCDSNDIYKFVVTPQRQQPDCIHYDEFDDYGDEFAREVDSTIDALVADMESAFGRECLKRAIDRGDTIRVEVLGFTDPRAYKANCLYTGATVDFSKSVVQVADEKKFAFVHNTPMKTLDKTGNQLLSDLRAYYMATLLDSVWADKVGRYRALRERGKLQVMAIGNNVSQEVAPYERQRSVQVRVTLPKVEAPPAEEKEPAPPGERIVFCDMCR